MNYEAISPTATIIAWLRSNEGVDYAEAIALLADVKDEVKAFYHDPHFDIDLPRMRKMGPWAVLRLFSLQEAILATGARNVLELASGLSPSGLLMSEDHPDMEYLETDLLPMHTLKAGIAERILEGRERPNLRFMPVDVMEREQVAGAVASFTRSGSMAVVNEGLLQYFTHEEKAELARTIHATLPKNGVWITPDIVRKEDFNYAFSTSAYVQKIRDITTLKTGRDLVDCAFSSFKEAEALFRECGFAIVRHRQLDLLTSPLFTPQALENHRNLQVQEMWEMRPV